MILLVIIFIGNKIKRIIIIVLNNYLLDLTRPCLIQLDRNYLMYIIYKLEIPITRLLYAQTYFLTSDES